jgi:Domain of unknown function (DUF4351)
MTATTPPKTDQDSPWKRILRQYFPEAIQFFFPDIAALVDWTQPPEFLDKEFTKIAPDAKVGRRFADQLVRVKLKRGCNLILLIHIEIQAAAEKDFAERMFIYALRIFDYFRQPAVSLAILCDARANWRPQSYGYELPQTKLNFEFGTVKLLDYRHQPTALNSANPFAIVVKAHLKMQETRRDPPTRKQWKMRLIRELYEAGYNQNQVVDLFNFLDWILILPKHLETAFWLELKAYEEERKVAYISSIQRIGIKEGRKEGRKEGIEEERRSLIQELLEEQVGPLTGELQAQVETLDLKQLKALGKALLKFSQVDDLKAWLARQI